MWSLRLLLVLVCISVIQPLKVDFSSVERAIQLSIQNKTFPSASVTIATSKEVLFSKVFGNFTYNSTEPTLDSSPYDIASLSKVVGTLPSVVRLIELKKIELDDLVIKYIPEFNNNGKGDITIRNLLLHNSGLPADDVYYTKYNKSEDVVNAIFNLAKVYKTGTQMVYSCLGFITLGKIVERVSGMPLDQFAHQNVFGPLEMFRTLYAPPQYLQNKCVPTEIDTYWRHRLVQGTVHDENAALLNGVSGNAGVFSVAKDLVKYMQMWLNNGTFTDSRGLKRQFFSQKTAQTFTQCASGLPYDNSRALGWDTKPKGGTYGPPCGNIFSPNSFGHTGFTGTSVWADREKDLIVIILTNKVYPNRDSSSLTLFRPALHDQICRLMGYTDAQTSFRGSNPQKAISI